MYVFSVTYPPNAQIFNKYLISFIEFQVINPQRLIQMYDPKFTFARMISGAKALKAGEEVSGIEDFNLFIIMFSAGLFGLILFLVVAIIP